MHWTMRTNQAPGDLEAVAALLSQIRPEPVTPAEIEDRRSWLPEGSIRHEIVAEHSESRFVGFAEAYRYPNTLRGKFYVNLAVDRAARGQGVGQALLQEIERFAASHGATLLVTEIAERDPASLAFAQHRGYAIRRLGYDSVLDLSRFDKAGFSGVADGVRQGGIRFFTLADSPSEGMKQALYKLYEDTFTDIPGYEAERFMAFETWHSMVIESGGARPDWVIIAAEGERLAGATTLVDRGEYLYTNHTVVRPEFRGRKIALALKLQAIKAALRHGATRMITGNDSRNEPMLAVNRKLGYLPETGTYELAKHPQ